MGEAGCQWGRCHQLTFAAPRSFLHSEPSAGGVCFVRRAEAALPAVWRHDGLVVPAVERALRRGFRQWRTSLEHIQFTARVRRDTLRLHDLCANGGGKSACTTVRLARPRPAGVTVLVRRGEISSTAAKSSRHIIVHVTCCQQAHAAGPWLMSGQSGVRQ